MNRIDRFLSLLVSGSGSDLHLSANRPPVMRIHGTLAPIPNEPVLSSEDILALLKEILPAENITQLEQEQDTDAAYEIKGLARFRVNGFRDMAGYGTVMRVIPEKIPTFEELNLPQALHDFCRLSKGLVVVTGPTGSGKSTTLSAMVDYINRTRNEHIITIEDPIEFVHIPAQCVINQREVHRDTESFARALRAALREDPDIVLVGEIRDLETMEIAIETAETGHLVFATLHTNTAASTVERMIDKFPADRQNQIRSMLADTLKGVVAQTLCKRVGGGRIAAFEVLVINTPVSALIREGKTHMLPSVMQTGRNVGMLTFSDELTRLALKGEITVEDAYVKAVNKEEIETKFRTAGLSLDFKNKEAQAALEAKLTKERARLTELQAKSNMLPGDTKLMCEIVEILAASPLEALRNGKEALKVAERAASITREKDPDVLVALASAQAETGNFRRAIDALKRAIALYAQNGDTLRGSSLAPRIQRFESKEPYRTE